jgi:hypothetical protein
LERLRGITSKLDGQIKDTLVLLAQTRKELRDTPATAYPDGPTNPINYTELLAYARRISKTTLPPTIPSGDFPPAESAVKPDSGTETAATTPGDTPNGVTTTSQSTNPMNGEPISQQTVTSTTSTSLPEHIQQHLNSTGPEFVPWPTADDIRQGALANIAYLADQGINAEGYDPAEEEARKKREEEEAKAQQDRERLLQEENERKLREQREKARLERAKEREKEETEGWRRASENLGGAAPAPSAASPTGGEKKQFQFMGGDDDDDDSD